jgi:hypothetical protein
MRINLSFIANRMRAIAADWPLLPRSIAIASGHLGIFFAICSLSYLDLPIGLWLAAVLFSALALASPLSGLLLILIAVDFQYLFWFEPSAFYRIIGLLSLVYCFRVLPITLRELSRLSPLWIALLFFITIVFLHLSVNSGYAEILQALGFSFLTAAVFLHARHAVGTPDAIVAIATVCLSGLATSILSFIYLYLPAPGLFLSHSPLYDLRLNDLRLSGALDNPNATAKLAVPGIIALMLLVVSWCRPVGLWLMLLAVSAILVTAAASKSILLSMIVIGLILCGLAARQRLLMLWLATLTGLITIVVVFSIAFFPLVKEHAASFWEVYSEPEMHAEYYAKLAEVPVWSLLRAESRIAVSNDLHLAPKPNSSGRPLSETEIHEMLKNLRVPNSGIQIKGKKGEELRDTGQRLRLLKAGLKVIFLHPWWGIGYKQWPSAMIEVTGFPFGSPHNVLLEVWGSYGVLGAILYLMLIAVAARNFVVIEKTTKDAATLWLNRGIGLFLLALLLHEMVEVATVLAITPYALWAWTALGLQDGLVRRQKAEAARLMAR